MKNKIWNFVKDKYVYVVTFAIALIMMLGAWIIGEIGPFGCQPSRFLLLLETDPLDCHRNPHLHDTRQHHDPDGIQLLTK